jgi:DNA-binding PadR family transcriptional regulator
MTEGQTIAWILLSVPESPGTLQDIIAMADAINHAIPSHQELQTSLGWLLSRDLIGKSNQKYALTEAGSQLLSETRGRHRYVMKIWDLVADRLETMPGPESHQDDITAEDTARAYLAYKKDFRRRYEGSNKRDSDA